MRPRTFSIVTIMTAILLSSNAFAQTRNWNAILDRYESICAECADMKAKVEDGGRVSKRKLASLVEELGVLRSTIQDGAGEMDRKQLARFENIRRKYSGVSRSGAQKPASQPAVTAVTEVNILPAGDPPKREKAKKAKEEDSSPAIADTTPAASGRILTEPLQNVRVFCGAVAETELPAPAIVRTCKPAPAAEPITNNYHWGISLLAGLYPDFSIGAMLTYIPSSKPIGAYIAYRNGFDGITPDYQCLSDGTADGYVLWLSGASQRHRAMTAAGPVLRLSERLSVYTGVGYGSFVYCWEDVDGNWAEVSDYSCRGFSCEAGLLYDIGRCRIGAGVGVTALRYSDLEISFGLKF